MVVCWAVESVALLVETRVVEKVVLMVEMMVDSTECERVGKLAALSVAPWVGQLDMK